MNISTESIEFNFSQNTTVVTESGAPITGCSNNCNISKPTKNENITFFEDSIGLINATGVSGDNRTIEKENRDFTVSFDAHNRVDSVNTTLIYNGSYGTSEVYQTVSGTGAYSNTVTFDVPLVGSNMSSKDWKFDLTANLDGSGSSSINYSEDSSNDSIYVFRKVITACGPDSVSQDAFHKYKVFNEQNRSQEIDADLNYNFDVTHHGEHSRNYAFGRSGSGLETCIYPSWAEYQITGPIQYNNDSFTSRNYNFFETEINNQTDTINLYLLPTEDSTAVYYRVENNDGSGVGEATIKTMRYFVDKDSYLTVSKVETDSNGQAQSYQKIDDVYYKYVITKDGEVLKETGNEILTCQNTPCEKVFQVDPDGVSDYFKKKSAWSFDCRVNEGDPSLQCTVNHDSDSMEKATLEVFEGYRIGDDNKICDIETQQTGSSMVCQVNNLSEHSYTYELNGFKDGEKTFLTTDSLDRTDGIFGDDSNGLFMALFMVLIAAGLGTYSPGAGIMWTGIGLTGVYMIGLFSIPLTALTGILAVAVIAAMEVSR